MSNHYLIFSLIIGVASGLVCNCRPQSHEITMKAEAEMVKNLLKFRVAADLQDALDMVEKTRCHKHFCQVRQLPYAWPERPILGVCRTQSFPDDKPEAQVFGCRYERWEDGKPESDPVCYRNGNRWDFVHVCFSNRCNRPIDCDSVKY